MTYHEQRPDAVVDKNGGSYEEHGESDEFVELYHNDQYTDGLTPRAVCHKARPTIVPGRCSCAVYALKSERKYLLLVYRSIVQKSEYLRVLVAFNRVVNN